MKRLLAVLVIVVLFATFAAPVAARPRRQAPLAPTPAPLTFRPYCEPNGRYAALIIGTGTVDQPIDWSPNAAFSPIQAPGVSNLLEGDSGALDFSVAEYPNGVWVRWSNFPAVVTHIPVPICHVVVVWMENKEASAITASSMPYLYGLSQTYGRATQVYGVTHPSQPNYIAFWSGSTQGVTTNSNVDITAPNLSSQLTAAGKQWRVYAQNVPAGCFTGATSTGGTDGPGVAGTYARKHEPAISFTSVSGTPTECAKIQPLAAFSTSAAVAFVAPNLCNDMHDCSLAQGDAFLQAFLPSVFNNPDWAKTLLIVTFDEGTSNANGGGNIFTLVARQGLSGVVSGTFHNHYGVLRTIEDLFGLPCLGSACSADPLSEFLP